MQEHVWTWRGQRIAYTRIEPAQRADEPNPLNGPPLRRAVLCIHGFGANKGHWRHNLQALAGDGPLAATVYAIDLLGFGNSSKPLSQLSGEAPLPGAVRYGFDLWAEQIVDFCREVIGLGAATATPEPIQLQLIGNSIGGVVALNTARLLLERGLHPQQLILIDCAERELDLKRLAEQPWPARLGRPLLMAVVRQRWLVGSLFGWLARASVVRQVLLQAYPTGRNVDAELVELLLGPSRDPGARESFRGFVNLFDDWLAPQLLAELSQQEPALPVRMLWGAADPWEPLAEAQRWQREFACVQELTVLPGLGHCPHDEAPELVNPILQAWLQRAWAITNERGRSRNLPEVGT